MLLAVILLSVQCTRRLYDTHFVSVFGKNSRMDLSHYILGLIHYIGAYLAVLSEASMFTNEGTTNEVILCTYYIHFLFQ